MPFVHVFEQQSLPVLHALPEVLHAVVSGAQTPPVQLPPQHCALEVHFRLSEMHAVALHFAFSQRKLQQSVAELQASLVAPHVVNTDVQLLLFASHTPEQQSAPLTHASLKALQLELPEPPEPLCPPPAGLPPVAL